MLVLGREETAALLEPDALRAAVAQALAEVSAGGASMPPRIAALVPARDALLAAMPAHLPAAGALAAKLVTLFPHNRAPLATHQAVVVVFDAATGRPEALLDGTSITAERTAAGAALATELLAREGARVLVVLGTGVQARSHLRAVPRVRAFTEVRVWGRDRARAAALAAEAGATSAPSLAEACRGADVICACTHPAAPVVLREHLDDGTHVTSVGFDPVAAEVDAATVADALVVVESRAAALSAPPAGSVDLAGVRDAVELGELVTGARPGRTSARQLTLYKSVGVAAQDAAAARLVLDAARERGLGVEVDL